jgi:hypothetical protein
MEYGRTLRAPPLGLSTLSGPRDAGSIPGLDGLWKIEIRGVIHEQIVMSPKILPESSQRSQSGDRALRFRLEPEEGDFPSRSGVVPWEPV